MSGIYVYVYMCVCENVCVYLYAYCMLARYRTPVTPIRRYRTTVTRIDTYTVHPLKKLAATLPRFESNQPPSPQPPPPHHRSLRPPPLPTRGWSTTRRKRKRERREKRGVQRGCSQKFKLPRKAQVGFREDESKTSRSRRRNHLLNPRHPHCRSPACSSSSMSNFLKVSSLLDLP